MDLRQGLFALAAEHDLDAAGLRTLERLAGLEREPDRSRASAAARASRCWRRRSAASASSSGSPPTGRRSAASAASRCSKASSSRCAPARSGGRRPRAPLGLLALLAIGGLFAYFGQTYQTGADPWQLFAVWAALALPLCIAARSDVLWAPWALVVMTGISLWTHCAHRAPLAGAARRPARAPLRLGRRARARRRAERSVSAPHRRGVWALRTAITLAAAMIATTAIAGLVGQRAGLHYVLGLAVLAVGAWMLSRRESFDVFGLSAIALGLDALLVGGLAYVLLRNANHGDAWILALLVVGLVAAALMAGTVSLVLRLSRRQGIVR
jgi:hypothetical protein